MGKLTLEKLVERGGALHIERFQDTLRKGGRSSQTILNARNVLRGALSYAVRMGLIDVNPVTRVIPPPASRFEGQTIDDDGGRRLIQAIRGDRLEAAIYLELACGLRRSEVLGLEWNAIEDLDAPTIDPRRRPRLHVRQTRQSVKGIGMVLQEPKTRRSRRTLLLPPFLVRVLRERREQQVVEMVRRTTVLSKHRFVFTNPDGSPIAPNTFTRGIKALLMKAGLPPTMRGHDLRHSFASILQAEGLPLSGTMGALGHSSVNVTMGIYAHATDPLRAMAADIFDAYYLRVQANS
jgi:integrase